MAGDPSVAIAADDLGRTFGEVTALEHVTFSVTSGTIVGVIGPSGAGKTTAVRILTGALAPTSGSATVLGHSCSSLARRTRERIGYMPQLFSLFPDLTVGENVDFVASLFGLLLLRRRRRVRRVLELVDLWPVRGRKASQLSGGMQRRLELACALVHEPAVVFLDEPTAGLDPLLRTAIWTELHRLSRSGCTVLVTTQYVGEAEECDEVVLFSEGQLVSVAQPDEMRRDATQGEVIELQTRDVFDGDRLAGLPIIRSVRQLSGRELLVTTDNAGTGLPVILNAVEDLGGVVTSSREYRPSFDEVFATLISRHRATLGQPPDGAIAR
ncbi:MAG TPA: ABC transporter ATP-binding protein [Candidatus Limnocylindrales bacterium]|nr:ABC transporter ATP-binding protein [Candidatus Limnocylindrales bacterium]